jgi:hypothetical protein
MAYISDGVRAARFRAQLLILGFQALDLGVQGVDFGLLKRVLVVLVGATGEKDTAC